jgi:hypothetical protein
VTTDHFHNPILAGIDLLSGIAIVGWWFDVIAHPVGTIATALAGVWYAYCLFEAFEKRFKK